MRRNVDVADGAGTVARRADEDARAHDAGNAVEREGAVGARFRDDRELALRMAQHDVGVADRGTRRRVDDAADHRGLAARGRRRQGAIEGPVPRPLRRA